MSLFCSESSYKALLLKIGIFDFSLVDSYVCCSCHLKGTEEKNIHLAANLMYLFCLSKFTFTCICEWVRAIVFISCNDFFTLAVLKKNESKIGKSDHICHDSTKVIISG